MAFVFWLILILFVAVSIALPAIILLQEPKQSGGLGGLDGSGGADFSNVRGVAGGLHNLTVWMAVIWGLLALALAVVPRA